MNTPINFEIAKSLKKQGFENLCNHYYFEYGVLVQHSLKGTNGYYGEDYEHELEEFYENWNDAWMTKKNGDRCFGCSKSQGYFETFSAPTIAEVVMWLYEKHGIWIKVNWYNKNNNNIFWSYTVEKIAQYPEPIDYTPQNSTNTNSPIEAYEAAIKYTLNNLI
jgi:hypothetical protein